MEISLSSSETAHGRATDGDGRDAERKDTQLGLTVAAVLFKRGSPELDAAVTGTVLREGQILRIRLCVQHTHL